MYARKSGKSRIFVHTNQPPPPCLDTSLSLSAARRMPPMSLEDGPSFRVTPSGLTRPTLAGGTGTLFRGKCGGKSVKNESLKIMAGRPAQRNRWGAATVGGSLKQQGRHCATHCVVCCHHRPPEQRPGLAIRLEAWPQKTLRDHADSVNEKARRACAVPGLARIPGEGRGGGISRCWRSCRCR